MPLLVVSLVLAGCGDDDSESSNSTTTSSSAVTSTTTTVRDGIVRDHSLPGSPEYGFYEVTPARAFGYGADGLTATRWRFG